MNAFLQGLTLFILCQVSPCFGVVRCGDVLRIIDAGDDSLSSFTLVYKNVARLIMDFRAYAKEEYGSKVFLEERDSTESSSKDVVALSFFERLAKLGNGFERLLVDPGLVQRLSEFERFVASKQFQDPWIARDAFSDSLGTQTVYRAAALSDSERDDILSNGFPSSLYRSLRVGIENERYVVVSLSMSRRSKLLMHAQYALTDGSPFLSVTGYPEIAVAVTKRYERESGKETRLFKITLPKLELIRLDPDNGIWPPGVDYSIPKVIRLNGKPKTIPPSNEIEQFGFFWISPKFISEVLVPEGIGPL